MKKVYSHLLCVLSIPLISVDICNAQSAPSTALALKPPPTAVVIDGSSQEWGDSLRYYNSEKKIHYTLSNDKDNLYLVVKTKDPVQQNNILYAGLTFSVDTKGRKKSAFNTTFPAITSTSPASSFKPNETLEQKTIRANFTKFKRIAVNGFKDISDDDLGTTNTYGILVAINYDADGSLVYEEAIPLTLFHAGDLAKNEWSFNIKMNGVDPPSQSAPADPSAGASAGGGMSSRSSSGGGRNGRRGTDASASLSGNQPQGTSTIDFWGKFTLVQ